MDIDIQRCVKSMEYLTDVEVDQNQSNPAPKRNTCDHGHTLIHIDLAVTHSSTRAHLHRLTSQVPVSTQTHPHTYTQAAIKT